MLTREEYYKIHDYDEYVKKELEVERRRLANLEDKLADRQRFRPKMSDKLWALFHLAGMAFILCLMGSTIPAMIMAIAARNWLTLAVNLLLAIILYPALVLMNLFAWRDDYNCFPFGEMEQADGRRRELEELARACEESKEEVVRLERMLAT